MKLSNDEKWNKLQEIQVLIIKNQYPWLERLENKKRTTIDIDGYPWTKTFYPENFKPIKTVHNFKQLYPEWQEWKEAHLWELANKIYDICETDRDCTYREWAKRATPPFHWSKIIQKFNRFTSDDESKIALSKQDDFDQEKINYEREQNYHWWMQWLEHEWEKYDYANS